MSGKVLIVIPFWHGDVDQATRLSDLLTDITTEHSDLADILFLARFDTAIPEPAVRYAAKRFNVHKYQSRRKEVGWPHGCNGTLIGAMEWLYGRVKAGTYPRYKCAFIAEGDSAPLTKDWLLRVHNTWDAAAKKKAVIAGPIVNAGGIDHVNGGGCLLSASLPDQKWLNQILHRSLMAGWDWALAYQFEKRGWMNVPGMRSYWHSSAFDETRWHVERAQDVWWIHGVKDDSLTKLARKFL
jgi:hypothetical protein